MKYSFVIDEKSLFIGVKNDYSRGQSPTVHTPLNQSKDREKWHTDIYEFLANCKSTDINRLPDTLIQKCLKKTTSKSATKLVGLYIFSRFALDGVPFEVDSSFAMYVKEETDKKIVGRDGRTTTNTHYGRQKLHYPISFIHVSNDYNINNKTVLDAIINVNGGFAFVVNGFEYDTETKILNFKTTMIGPEGVLLSNVFIRKKGVGVKLLVDGIESDNSVYPSTINSILTKEENDAFIATLEKIQKTSRSNGLKGEEYVYANLEKIIGMKPEDSHHISKLYPQSPYDIECKVNGEIKYIEVKSTKTNKKIFYMSRGERKFMDKYDQHYLLILVTNVNSEHRKYTKYQRNDIMNSAKMDQECQSIKFIVK